jgi:spore coat protein CotH
MVFKSTDVRVPATLQVDGKTYPDVGVQFHGNSSFSQVPETRKHSMTLEMDFAHKNQSLGGYRTVTLLNSHEDPTYLRSVLFLTAARSYLPAAKANFARVVINGESWGIYPNIEHFNKDFVEARFQPGKGDARWKVPGSPGARGGLEYLGQSAASYRRIYEIKSSDDPQAWSALINLTQVLNQTPPDQLERALAPILDIDGALKFLAIDNAFVNNDGYWTRASDYSIYLDSTGRFHILPYDTNETFGMSSNGAGGGRGARGGGPELDPLVGLDDASKPLRSRLLAVPALRARYLSYMRDIATHWLDWSTLEPLVARSQALIREDMRTDTRKLDSFEEFEYGGQTMKDFTERRSATIFAPQ